MRVVQHLHGSGVGQKLRERRGVEREQAVLDPARSVKRPKLHKGELGTIGVPPDELGVQRGEATGPQARANLLQFCGVADHVT